MKTTRTVLIALSTLLLVSACTDGDLSGATTLPDEVEEVAEELRNEMEEIGSQIEDSEAAEDLRQGWSEVRTEMEAAIEAISNNVEFDTAELEAAMEEFQADLEAAGDQVDDDLLSAWNAIRAQIERLFS